MIHRAFILGLVVLISNTAWAIDISEPVVNQCERSINLFDVKPDNIIDNTSVYAVHYKYEANFPSKEAFYCLEKQLLHCGWKQYTAFDSLVNDPDWTSYLKRAEDGGTTVVHAFGRTYINAKGNHIAIILLRYVSGPVEIKKAVKIKKPINNIQYITIQFIPFNEEEYRRSN